MRFLRNLTAAVLAVGVIIGLGMLWAHLSGGGPGPGPGPGIRHGLPREALLRLSPGKAALIRARSLGSASGFQLVNVGNLVRTMLVEALLAAAVITVSAIRRRLRRIRRTAASA